MSFASKVRVKVPDEATAIDVFAANVSRGGIFLRSTKPLPKGKKISLEFETQAGPVTVEEGEVVWNNPFEPVNQGGQPAGMGVQFITMGQDSKNRIESFMSDQLGQAPQPSGETPKSVSAVFSVVPEELSSAPQPAVGASVSEPNQIGDLNPLITAPPASELEGPSEGLPVPASLADPLRPSLDISSLSSGASQSAPDTRAGGSRKRTLGLAIFVVLLAAGTFFTLLLLEPFDGQKASKPADAVAPAPQTQPAPAAAQAAVEPLQEAQKAPEPAPVPGKAPAVAVAPPPVEAPKVAIAPATKRPINPPTFTQTKTGWRMTFKTPVGTEVKHFTLTDPPRLAVDFSDARYTGKGAWDGPTPFITKIRIGDQGNAIRLVFDFRGAKIPPLQVQKNPDSFVVDFTTAAGAKPAPKPYGEPQGRQGPPAPTKLPGK